ncbi:MAG: hypothetical protein MZV64_74015 [Ignavibacteriales bacterium]|nr:hypothetical protein [Ignavibacteriales bacterium]
MKILFGGVKEELIQFINTADESLALMREAGCRMIFFGAETGNDAILKQMDKGRNSNR